METAALRDFLLAGRQWLGEYHRVMDQQAITHQDVATVNFAPQKDTSPLT